MQKITISFLFLILFSAIAFAWLSFSKSHREFIADHGRRSNANYKPPPSKEFLKLQSKALIAKKFIQQKKFDTSICFLIDMSLPSGKNRFFIYNLAKDSLLKSGLVAHGSCNTYYLENVFFSNNISCGCSSKGKYKIGYKYNGSFGKSYKLYGLDSSNSNAAKRSIVLHAYKEVPDHEIYPDVIGNSLGCPMVSYLFLSKISKIIDTSKKPILLWIFN